MKTQRITILSACALMLVLASVSYAQISLTEFTWRGSLVDGTSLLDGQYDLRFQLFDMPEGGMKLGTDNYVEDVNVNEGCFETTLDFGVDILDGRIRYLEIAYRLGDLNDTNIYTVLDAPRKEVIRTHHTILADTVGVTGNVGIGTNYPTRPLDIFSGFPQVIFSRPGGNSYEMGVGTAAFAIKETDGEYLFWIEKETGNVGIGKTHGSYLAWIESETGNIGIGTKEPEREFHIRRSENESASLRLEGHRSENGGWANVIDLYAPVSPAAPDKKNFSIINRNAQSAGDENRLDFRSAKDDGSTSEHILTMTHGGNVGIGTAYPTYKLDVEGDIRCVDLHETSDKRFKTNVTELTDALDKVERIRGVSFEWNDKAESIGARTGQKQIGIVAQEIESVLPELVATSDEGYKSVDYSKLTAVLVEAVKELKTENESLRSRIQALETSLNRD